MKNSTPHAEFVVSGKVTDTAGQGLPGIRVMVPKVDHRQRATPGFIPGTPFFTEEIRDTSYTQTNGTFTYRYNGMPTNDSINIYMKFEGSAENIRYEADSVKVTFFSGTRRFDTGISVKRRLVPRSDGFHSRMPQRR